MTFEDFRKQATVYVEYPSVGGSGGDFVSVDDAMSCSSLPLISLKDALRLKLITKSQYSHILKNK